METPKEKAKELVNKMKLATDEFGYININIERHKQCALIAVDEIIKALMYPPQLNEYRQVIHIKVLQYWQEVKIEIEKL
jgi:hypothetical protein